MNDIKKTVLSKFVVQTPTLETNEINTNSLTLAGQSLEEFIEQNMGGAEAIEQLQSKVGTLETSVGEINGEIEELSSKSYAYTDAENIFSSVSTFEAPIHTNNIVVNGGSLTFTDVIDGTVFDTENPMASGYRYIEGIPSSFNNGFCYDIGEISDSTNLKNITFSANGRLIQTCELWFRTSATAPTNHQWPANTYWIDSATGAAPTLLASKNYRIVFRQEPKKIIASIAYLY